MSTQPPPTQESPAVSRALHPYRMAKLQDALARFREVLGPPDAVSSADPKARGVMDPALKAKWLDVMRREHQSPGRVQPTQPIIGPVAASALTAFQRPTGD